MSPLTRDPKLVRYGHGLFTVLLYNLCDGESGESGKMHGFVAQTFDCWGICYVILLYRVVVDIIYLLNKCKLF